MLVWNDYAGKKAKASEREWTTFSLYISLQSINIL